MTDLKDRIANTIEAVKESLEKNTKEKDTDNSLEKIKKLEEKIKKE